MNDKDKAILLAAWEVIQQQQDLLGILLRTGTDIGQHLIEERKPSPEQFSAWSEAQQRVSEKMLELVAAIAAVHQAVVPLLRADA